MANRLLQPVFSSIANTLFSFPRLYVNIIMLSYYYGVLYTKNIYGGRYEKVFIYKKIIFFVFFFFFLFSASASLVAFLSLQTLVPSDFKSFLGIFRCDFLQKIFA